MALKAYGAKIPMVWRLFAKELFQLRFLVFTFPFHFKHKEDTFESDKVTRTHTHTHSLTHTLTKPLTYTYIYNMKKCEERERV